MTRKITWIALLAVNALLCWGGLLSCASGEDDSDMSDTVDPWENGTESDSSNHSETLDYSCFDSTNVDLEECGEYPEEEGWDLGQVVTNITFKAYYDRDCDGEMDATELNMYRDVYCNRDKIKSIVMIAGSNCGEDDDAEP